MQRIFRTIAPPSVLAVALLVVVVGCQRTEPPPPTASTRAAAPSAPVPEPVKCSDCVPVTADSFNRAESDMYFVETSKLAGGIGKFDHRREIMPIDKQTVIRANRDTLYSAAVSTLMPDR